MPNPFPIDDDLLRNFARGQLDASEAERVAEALAQSLELQARLNSLTGDAFLSKLRKVAVNYSDDQETTDAVPNLIQPKGSRVIGRYKLLQLIGEGGMGQVWMAEQSEPVKRRVALKLIKTGKDTKPITARFEAERQALALMDHASIARIFDGGTTETGEPYFVMELVQGIPITQYCDKHRLGLPERLQLFTQACNAVQHAHQKAIIHRDLKPSNILVAVHDGKPLAKVIDFGLAKALDRQSKLTEKTLFTEFGAVVGTLQYMSPEQAELVALDIDTRADIYSLGVLLYELLTGSTPIELETLKKVAVLKILETIRETDPQRPSERLSSSGNLIADISARRQIEPARLQQELRGDLDWIVMKALEKERSRRYESASGFAADIQRYLTDQPVTARPPSAAYRIQKFLKKNRGPVITATAVVLLLVAGLVGTLVGLREANIQTAAALIAKTKAQQSASEAIAAKEEETKQRKTAEENLARAEKAESETKERVAELEELTEFQQSQLSGIDVPKMGIGLRLSLIEQIKSRLDSSKLSGEEIAQQLAALDVTLSKANFVDLSLALLRENIFETAYKTIQEKYKSRPLFVATMLHTLGRTTKEIGLLPIAEKSFSEALRIHRRELGNDHSATLSSINNLGVVLNDQGRSVEAEPLYREALEARRRILGNEHLDTLASTTNMAGFLRAQGNMVEAEFLCREALEASRRILGNEHPETLHAIFTMVGFLQNQGKMVNAEPLCREALETSRRNLEKDNPITLKFVGNLTAILLEQGKFGDAEPLGKEALEAHRRILGNEHPATLMSIYNMADFLKDQGRTDEAEPLYREALEVSRSVQGNEHPNTLTIVRSLAILLNNQGKLNEAERLRREDFEALRKTYPEDDPKVLQARVFLGGVLRKLNRLNEAIENYSLPSKLGDIRAIKDLFETYQLAERPNEIVQAAPEFAAKQRELYQAKPDMAAAGLRIIARALNRIDAFQAAEPYARESLDLATKAGINDWRLARIQSTLGTTILGLGQIDEATRLLKSSYEQLQAIADKIPSDVRDETLSEAKAAGEKLELRSKN